MKTDKLKQKMIVDYMTSCHTVYDMLNDWGIHKYCDFEEDQGYQISKYDCGVDGCNNDYCEHYDTFYIKIEYNSVLKDIKIPLRHLVMPIEKAILIRDIEKSERKIVKAKEKLKKEYGE